MNEHQSDRRNVGAFSIPENHLPSALLAKEAIGRAQQAPGPWRVFNMGQYMPAAQRWVVKRDTPQGMEFLLTRGGWPREFRTAEAAYAAISKAALS